MEMANLNIICDLNRCTGCRGCEIACSLHLTGMIAYKKSAIRLTFASEGGVMRFSIGKKCDLCHMQEIPSCIEFCPTDAVSLRRVPSKGLLKSDRKSGKS